MLLTFAPWRTAKKTTDAAAESAEAAKDSAAAAAASASVSDACNTHIRDGTVRNVGAPLEIHESAADWEIHL